MFAHYANFHNKHGQAELPERLVNTAPSVASIIIIPLFWSPFYLCPGPLYHPPPHFPLPSPDPFFCVCFVFLTSCRDEWLGFPVVEQPNDDMEEVCKREKSTAAKRDGARGRCASVRAYSCWLRLDIVQQLPRLKLSVASRFGPVVWR